MRIEVGVPCPLPDDPLLAEVAVTVRDTEDWGSIVDPNWRRVYSSDDERRSFAGGGELATTVVGEHLFGPESVAVIAEARFAMTSPETWRSFFTGLGPLVLSDTPSGEEALRAQVDPRFAIWSISSRRPTRRPSALSSRVPGWSRPDPSTARQSESEMNGGRCVAPSSRPNWQSR